MTVGLPGAGIGGLFYLVAGLGMPVRESWLTVRGRSSRARWRTVLHQFTIAGGIFAGTWTSGWLLATLLLRLTPAVGAGAVAQRAPMLQHTADWLRPTHGLVQLATLAVILLATWVTGTLLGRRAPAAAPRPTTVALAAVALVGAELQHAAAGARSARDLGIDTRTPTPWRQRAVRHRDEG